MKLITTHPSRSQISLAREQAEELGELRNSIEQGRGNVAGLLAEIMVAEAIGAEQVFGESYDYDLKLGRCLIEVKAAKTTVVPLEKYEGKVPEYQACHFYIFTRVLDDYSILWIVGKIDAVRFEDESVRKLKGDRDGPFTYKRSCWTIPYSKLDDVTCNTNTRSNSFSDTSHASTAI